MPAYFKGDHRVNVSGDEEVARFEAAGYSLVSTAKSSEKAPVKKAAKKAPAKSSEK